MLVFQGSWFRNPRTKNQFCCANEMNFRASNYKIKQPEIINSQQNETDQKGSYSFYA